MGLQLDTDGLLELLRSFYTISHVRIGVFGMDGTELLAYPAESCEFCRILRSDRKFGERCTECDSVEFGRLSSGGKTRIYRCHAGLYEAIVPIECGQSAAACLMLGQAAPRMTEEEINADIGRKLEGHPEKQALMDAFARMEPKTEEELCACARIMSACAGFAYLKSMVQPGTEALSPRLTRYIRENYARPLSLCGMAEALGVSVTTLCVKTRQECGQSPHGLLTAFRIGQAAAMLERERRTVREIAADVGISDYNYFARVFRGHMGMSPSQWRKRAQRKYAAERKAAEGTGEE